MRLTWERHLPSFVVDGASNTWRAAVETVEGFGAGPDGGEPFVWRFSARRRPDTGRDTTVLFRDRLLGALRVAHGLALPFEFHLETGPSPALSLVVRTPAGHRWAARSLDPVYGPSRWTYRSGRPEPVRPGPWTATRARPLPLPLRPPTDRMSLFDVLMLAAATLPPGIRLEVGLVPLPVHRPEWWEALLSPAAPPPARTDGPAPRFDPRGLRPSPPTAGSGAVLTWNVRVALAPLDLERTNPALLTAAAAFERSSSSGTGNRLVFRPPGSLLARWGNGFVITEDEAVLFWPHPDGPSFGHPNPPPGTLWTLALGRSRAGGVIGPPLEPDQGRHLAVLGETGMGKSSLLVALAARARPGVGLVLFDPLGGTARALARELEPTGDDPLIRIDPELRPVEMNALEGIGAAATDHVHAERRLTDLVHAFRRVRAGQYSERSSFWGPRIDEMLTRALRAAAAFEHGTLVDAHTLLETHAHVHRDLPSDAMGPVRELSERMRDHPEDAEGARRVLHEVVRSPVLRRMLCAPDPGLSPRDLVVPGARVLLSGNAGWVGETTARYLLAVYLALLWSELTSRAERSKTFVFLDEAQWFSHESLGEMLRLGRASNVHVVMSTQSVASIPQDSVQEAIWTNVADFVAFRGSPDEAREFARIAPGIAPEEVLALPRGHAVVLLGKGEQVEWIRTARLPGSFSVPATHRAVPLTGPPPPTDRPNSILPAVPPPAAPSEARSPNALPPGPGHADPSPDDGVDRILDHLRALAARPDGDRPLRVPLDALRTSLGPTEPSLRKAGSLLGRCGALRVTERNGGTRVWVLEADRIPPPPSRAPSPRANDGSDPQKA